ncbi:MAG: hypothetical protein EOO56_16140 [Hymenobacter sp.]|nr:MAG: hypothetical protein EOO56_16140 [Hymenobacter sp.]
MRQLRGRVQDKLLNHLLFLDHSDPRFFVARRYELECLDLLHKLTILALEGEHQLSERLAKRCLRLAQEGEFTSYAEQAAQRLRILYAERGEQSEYLLIDKELRRLRQLLEWEQEAEQLSLEVRLNMVKTVTKRHDILLKVPAYLERLVALYELAGSFNTFVALYRLQLVYAELVGKYDDIVYYTEQADKLLAEDKLNPRRFDSRFNHFMSVYAHLRSRQAAKGLQLADEYAQEIHPTSSNWFFFYEHFLLLALHAANYEKASLLLHVVQKNPSFAKQRPAALARWELLEAYVELLQPASQVAPQQRNRMALFAALTVPEYTRDKRGHNVAILVFQLLHYLQQRNLEPVLARLERLRKYQQRHLRDAAALRSRTFLRLLLLLPEAEFDPAELARRGNKLLAQLRQAPLVGEAEAEIEIVPYEDLWKFTLDVLRQGAPG